MNSASLDYPRGQSRMNGRRIGNHEYVSPANSGFKTIAGFRILGIDLLAQARDRLINRGDFQPMACSSPFIYLRPDPPLLSIQSTAVARVLAA